MKKNLKVLKLDEVLQRSLWDVDEKPHIVINFEKCSSCSKKLCTLLCPAGCFTVIDNKVIYSYEGCLECGTCRTVCPLDAVEWKYPRSGKGIYYRFT